MYTYASIGVLFLHPSFMSRLLVDGWQVVIGLETHVQIKSSQKLFSKSPTSLLNRYPNTQYNAFDAAFPGTLPRLNRKCLDLALRAALALNCSIKTRSSFDRKHYFYSDQPAGYQITQHYSPFAVNGQFTAPKLGIPVRIKQIQLEQDTAKSVTDARTRTALIDLDRAGTGLLEIVTEPDFRSSTQAAEYIRSLQETLRALGVSDGNMEAGSFRCDVNVSINRPNEPPGTRCEVKNINSVKFMVAAIEYEIQRQRLLLETNGLVPQETRGFNHDSWKTFKMRAKEDAPEYRYMPDPNLGVLVLGQEHIEKVRREMPLLPAATRARLLETYSSSGVTESNIDVLMNLDVSREIPYDGAPESTIGAVAYFELLCSPGRDPKFVMNWMIQNLLGQLSALGKSFCSDYIAVAQMGELLDLVGTKQMSRSSAKLLLKQMLISPSNTPVKQLAAEMDLLSSVLLNTNTASVSPNEDDILHNVCVRAIAALPREIEAIRNGNDNVYNKVIGWIMRETKGKVDAKQTKNMLKQLIDQ
ncbi:Glutamyl-tRNA amidotransferase B subunit [Rhodocollybia butyracea]|uniref:Glutamyl-tRNA(Gln) amidotransferase subunit B, mitochondrial n=1 Tax=Rhodocollybia butyracea TaxID=206335 RepID=A0A9P5UA66_9AGAR|nr:Glutamyl-tRNA amidotransferase B subunit [Rhodocollybia butyracea]